MGMLELTFLLRHHSCQQLASRSSNSLLHFPQALPVAIMFSQALTQQLHQTISSRSLEVLVSMTRMVSSTPASHSMLLNPASVFDSFQHLFSILSLGSFGP